ncbi:MAG: TolC family protein [Desulfuromonadales bacterium]|nr:TolC family protein [Desulfuromonadales bacterium]
MSIPANPKSVGTIAFYQTCCMFLVLQLVVLSVALPTPVQALSIAGSPAALDLGALPQDRPPVPASYDLVASVERALEANPRIKAYRFRVEGARAESNIALSRMLPTISFSLSRSTIRNESARGAIDSDFIDQTADMGSLQFSQPLFAGMTLLNGYQRARLQQELAAAEKDRIEGQIILDVQMTYFDLLTAKGEVDALRSAVTNLETSVAAVRAYEQLRMAAYVDLLSAEADLADVRQQLSKAENQVAVLTVRLNALLGLAPTSAVAYAGNFPAAPQDLPWTIDAGVARAMEQRLDLVIQRNVLAIAEKDARIAAGQFLPRIDLQAAYNDLDKDFKEPAAGSRLDRDYETAYWSTSVSLKWNIFEGGRRHFNMNRADSEVLRAREELREAVDQVISQVHSFYLMSREARQRIDAAEQALSEAAEAKARAQVRFEARIGTVTELLDAESRLIRAHSNRLQARADYHRAVAQLLYAVGERNPALRF